MFLVSKRIFKYIKKNSLHNTPWLLALFQIFYNFFWKCNSNAHFFLFAFLSFTSFSSFSTFFHGRVYYWCLFWWCLSLLIRMRKELLLLRMKLNQSSLPLLIIFTLLNIERILIAIHTYMFLFVYIKYINLSCLNFTLTCLYYNFGNFGMYIYF